MINDHAILAQPDTHQNEALLFFTLLQLVIIVIMACVGGEMVGLEPSGIESERHSAEHSRIDGTQH